MGIIRVVDFGLARVMKTVRNVKSVLDLSDMYAVGDDNNNY